MKIVTNALPAALLLLVVLTPSAGAQNLSDEDVEQIRGLFAEMESALLDHLDQRLQQVADQVETQGEVIDQNALLAASLDAKVATLWAVADNHSARILLRLDEQDASTESGLDSRFGTGPYSSTIRTIAQGELADATRGLATQEETDASIQKAEKKSEARGQRILLSGFIIMFLLHVVNLWHLQARGLPVDRDVVRGRVQDREDSTKEGGVLDALWRRLAGIRQGRGHKRAAPKRPKKEFVDVLGQSGFMERPQPVTTTFAIDMEETWPQDSPVRPVADDDEKALPNKQETEDGPAASCGEEDGAGPEETATMQSPATGEAGIPKPVPGAPKGEPESQADPALPHEGSRGGSRNERPPPNQSAEETKERLFRDWIEHRISHEVLCNKWLEAGFPESELLALRKQAIEKNPLT